MANPEIEEPICSLLLFVATPTEEESLREEVEKHQLLFHKDKALNDQVRRLGLREEIWSLGQLCTETVCAVGCSRYKGNVVMGPHGSRGSASKAIRYLAATGAQGIIQLGTAFGISRTAQNIGDVLVSKSLIPYEQRDVKSREEAPGYYDDYTSMRSELAREALLDKFLREKMHGDFDFQIHVGAILSGSARIHCAAYRDLLYQTVPSSNGPIVGGEMEAVGLLAAGINPDNPVWCVVKGISDFADEQREKEIVAGRAIASKNAVHFTLSSLINHGH